VRAHGCTSGSPGLGSARDARGGGTREGRGVVEEEEEEEDEDEDEDFEDEEGTRTGSTRTECTRGTRWTWT